MTVNEPGVTMLDWKTFDEPLDVEENEVFIVYFLERYHFATLDADRKHVKFAVEGDLAGDWRRAWIERQPLLLLKGFRSPCFWAKLNPPQGLIKRRGK